MFVVFAAGTLSTLMQGFLTTSLPTIVTEIDGREWYGAINSVYLITATIFLPLLAPLGDRYGYRALHVAGMMLWTAGSGFVAVSSSPTEIIMSRAVQGVGAAAVAPAGVAILAALFGSKLGRMVGIYGAAQVMATMTGIPVGGIMSEILGWRVSVGYVCGAGGAVGLLAAAFIPHFPQNEHKRMSMKDLTRVPVIRQCLWSTFLLGGIAYGIMTYLPLFLSLHDSVGVRLSALLMVPCLIGVGIGSLIGGLYMPGMSVLKYSWGSAAIGLSALLADIPLVQSLGGGMACFGVGLSMPSLVVKVERAATMANASAAGGIVQAARNIGGALASLVLGLSLVVDVPMGYVPRIIVTIMMAVSLISWGVVSRTSQSEN